MSKAEEIVKRIGPWLPVIVVVAWFTYMAASWQRQLAFQSAVRDDMNAKLDEFLHLREGSAGESD